MNSKDYLIVGQGIAGTCLAIRLLRAGKKITIIDDSSLSCTSRVAAGFMHPITGRRIVKTWMADVIFPIAEEFYRSLESESGEKYYHSMDSLEMVGDIKTANEWSRRSDELPMYVSPFSKENPDYLQPTKAIYKVKGGGWLDLPTLLNHYRNVWTEKGIFIDQRMDESSIHLRDGAIEWNGERFKKVVFCQGIHARQTDFWKHLPFDPAKGELLTVSIPELPQTEILVNGLFLIPIGADQFRVGSTYSWHELTDKTTEKAREQLELKIRKTVVPLFKTIGQQAGVRPAVKDRRPLLGQHPDRRGCYIFNGLGSKGSSLAPWLSSCLLEHMENGTPLPEETEISRFDNRSHLHSTVNS
ncbi:MAG: NAD(P)/FAD-dependent oxidoreductase [Bacteroidota bacterium]